MTFQIDFFDDFQPKEVGRERPKRQVEKDTQHVMYNPGIMPVRSMNPISPSTEFLLDKVVEKVIVEGGGIRG
jgi:hypothetical protein